MYIRNDIVILWRECELCVKWKRLIVRKSAKPHASQFQFIQSNHSVQRRGLGLGLDALSCAEHGDADVVRAVVP